MIMNNTFIESIDSLKIEDLGDAKKEKKSVIGFILGNIRYVILLVCVAVLAVSLISIVKSLVGYSKAGEIYNDISVSEEGAVLSMFSSVKSPYTPCYAACQVLTDSEITDISGSSKVNRDFEIMRNKLYQLQLKYPDTYGWISIPGTNIEYPIMQSDDNSYYLDHSYNGAKLPAGAIFADYRNSRTLVDNYNLVLYGHHMTANLMFHSLDKYRSESFFSENNKIIIYTLDGMYTYEICSVYETDKYYDYIRTYFSSPDSFVIWATEMISNSIHETDKKATEHDRILTLSTCTNRGSDGRLCVQAIMVKHYSAN